MVEWLMTVGAASDALPKIEHGDAIGHCGHLFDDCGGGSTATWFCNHGNVIARLHVVKHKLIVPLDFVVICSVCLADADADVSDVPLDLHVWDTNYDTMSEPAEAN